MVGVVVPVLADNPPAYSLVLVSLHQDSSKKESYMRRKWKNKLPAVQENLVSGVNYFSPDLLHLTRSFVSKFA